MERNEAIKIVKSHYPANKQMLNEALEFLIPELVESEDERIRNFLIDYINHIDWGDWDFSRKQCIDWLEKQGEQKPADKVGPRFKVGEWVTNGNYTWKIVEVRPLDYILQSQDGNIVDDTISHVDEQFHSFTIEDAKEGDVLSYVTDEEDLWIMIYWSLYEPYEGHVHYHALLVNDNFSDKGTCCICINNLKPATKEQRDLLFQKMKEAGYEWDAEKKELKKFEDEEYNGEDYGIDSLYHAQRILEKTLGKVDGYQTDDGILSHKCAITAVKKLYEQKPAWNKEDKEKELKISSD